MLWIKALHIIFIITWFAGLFYIPRLFIYHIEAQTKEASAAQILIPMNFLNCSQLGRCLVLW